MRKDINTTINLSDKVQQLIEEQLSNWQLAKKNYEELGGVLLREFEFDGFSVKLQFNPARIVSSAAKTDAKSIAARKCFLCAANREEAQKSVKWGSYDILVNPFPIFSPHLVIAQCNHTDQSIVPYIRDMVEMTSLMSDYLLFFNGAQAGASAPDHMHFQACKVNSVPLVADYFRLKQKGYIEQLDANLQPINSLVLTGNINSYSENTSYSEFNSCYENTSFSVNTSIYRLKNYLRTVICLESDNKEDILSAFASLFNKNSDKSLFDKDSNKSLSEEMVNVVSYVADGRYYIFVLPRSKYRPTQYFATDESQRLLISPAAVEMAGLFITPIKEHFDKLTGDDVVDIFSQVSLEI